MTWSHEEDADRELATKDLPPHADVRLKLRQLEVRASYASSEAAVRLQRLARKTLRAFAGFPGWPMDRTTAERLPRIQKTIRQAVEAWTQPAGPLLIVGPSRAGKTTGMVHGAITLVERSIVERKYWPVPMFARAVDLANARRKHGLGAGDPPLIEQASTAQLLLLDDLGQEVKWDSTMFEVADARYAAGLPTWTTSGLTFQQLTDRYGEAHTARLLESGTKGRLVSVFETKGKTQ